MKGLARSRLLRAGWPIAAALALSFLPGCADPVDRLLADEAQRARLWDSVASNPELATQVVDRLLGTDSTRTALLDHLLSGGGVRQTLLMRVATDRSLMDGTVHFAVQDSAMRDHLMTLFRGMEMASGAPEGGSAQP